MFIDGYSLISLIICIFFLFCYGWYYSYQNKKTNKEITRKYQFKLLYNTKQLNYSKDIELLDMLVDKAVRDFTLLNIAPHEMTRTDVVINDEYVRDSTENLAVNIFGKLNDEYVTYLCTFYFKDKEAVMNYMVESISTSLIISTLEANLKKLRRS